MFTGTAFRLSTATFIFLAFFFRLAFVNICLFTSLETPQTNALIKSHFSSILKKRREVADVANKASFELAAEEAVCEAGSGSEEELAKVSSPSIPTVLHSFLKQISFTLRSHRSFDAIKCVLYPKKHLVLSILRI